MAPLHLLQQPGPGRWPWPPGPGDARAHASHPSPGPGPRDGRRGRGGRGLSGRFPSGAGAARPAVPTSSTWCSSVTRLCWDLVSVSFSSVLILKPSAFPVWLPCEGGGRSGSPCLPVGQGEVGWRWGWGQGAGAAAHVVEEVPDLQDQLAEDGQLAAGEQAWGVGGGSGRCGLGRQVPRCSPTSAHSRGGGRGAEPSRTCGCPGSQQTIPGAPRGCPF